MDVALAKARTTTMQLALRTLILLRLAAYLWPEDAVVNDLSCFDVIIVGGGTAGSILASRLVETGIYKVLLIEAGGDPPIESLYPGTYSYLPNSIHVWNFSTINDGMTAQEHKGNIFELTSGKTLGGDSSIGHMLYSRGHPKDYDDMAELLKDRSWNYNNLLPYFKKSEKLKDKFILESPYKHFHGTSGRMGLTRETHKISRKYLQAFRQAGHSVILDGNGNSTLGFFEPLLMINDGIRQNMAYCYLSPYRYHPNLTVMKNTEVIEIEFHNNTAIGVKAVKNGEVLRLRANREVIVAAGTIKSAQLLLLSGVGIEDQLETYSIPVKSDLPVGKNFRDHVGVLIVHKLNITDAKSHPANPHEFPLPVTVGNVAIDKGQKQPDYQVTNYVIASDSDEIISLCSTTYAFKDHVCQSLYEETKGSEILVTKLVLLHPNSKGHVILRSNKYVDDPMIISDYFFHDEDLERIVDSIEDFLQLGDTEVFKKYNAEFVKPNLTECASFPGNIYWKCYALSMMVPGYHYSGTCAMGSVVDNRLRVLGIERLRVVGAPVLPVTISGDIQAAVMAIAEKAADMIVEDYAVLEPLDCALNE